MPETRTARLARVRALRETQTIPAIVQAPRAKDTDPNHPVAALLIIRDAVGRCLDDETADRQWTLEAVARFARLGLGEPF